MSGDASTEQTRQPAQPEPTDPSRESVAAWIAQARLRPEAFRRLRVKLLSPPSQAVPTSGRPGDWCLPTVPNRRSRLLGLRSAVTRHAREKAVDSVSTTRLSFVKAASGGARPLLACLSFCTRGTGSVLS